MKKNPLRFLMGYLIYVTGCLFLITLGWAFFWNYMEAYEKAQPIHAIEKYMKVLDDERLRILAKPFLNKLEAYYPSEDEQFAALKEAIAGPYQYAKNKKESKQDELVYMIQSDKKTIGKVFFREGKKEEFGFRPWEVYMEDYQFDFLLEEDEVIVPNTWKVYYDDQLLGEESIIENIAFDELAYLSDKGLFALPYKQKYHLENALNKAKIRIIDEKGQERKEGDIHVDELMDNCMDEEKQRLENFAQLFIPKYVKFLSNADHRENENYQDLATLLVLGSDLDRRLYEAIAGQIWVPTQGDTITKIQTNRFSNLGNGYYLIDVTYHLDTQGGYGFSQSENRIQIIVQHIGGEVKALDIISA